MFKVLGLRTSWWCHFFGNWRGFFSAADVHWVGGCGGVALVSIRIVVGLWLVGVIPMLKRVLAVALCWFVIVNRWETLEQLFIAL